VKKKLKTTGIKKYLMPKMVCLPGRAVNVESVPKVSSMSAEISQIESERQLTGFVAPINLATKKDF